MSIIRLVDGKPVVFANNITDHKQLKGKDEYGCHPIQAIRNLPEKLSALKEKDTNLENSINGLNNKIESLNVSALSAKVNEVEQSVKVIDIQENENEGTFTFTNYAGKQTKTIQSGYKPDNINLELNNDKTLTLKKISTDTTLKGLGIESNKLGVNIDNSTLIQNSNSKLEVIGINDGQTLLTGHFINQKLSDINNDIGNLTQTINNNKEELNQYNKTQDNRINDLYTRTTGLGGYLDANNFGSATPTQDQLTNYALQQISSAQGNKLNIYNQTKVKNLFDGNVWILTNIPDADPAIYQWANKGPENIGDANNDGIHGLITGSYEEFEGSVDSLGHLTINGLEENINRINASLANKANLSGDKNKYYRHYIQLTVDDKTLYYDFISRDENAYVTNTLPTMLDNIITPIQVLSNGYYSWVSGRIYKDGNDSIKVTVHGMYTSDGANQTYLSLTDIYATFVSDNVIGL